MFYDIFLKIYGLRGILLKTKNVDDTETELKEISINIVEDEMKIDVVKQQKPFYKRNTFRAIINNAYRIFILLLLLFECIYPIIEAGIYATSQFFTSSIFPYMYLSQYVFGLTFYGGIFYENDFYDKAMKRISEYHKLAFVLYVICSIIATVGSLVAIIIVIFGDGLYTGLYKEISLGPRILLLIYVVLNRFYSYSIFLINAVTFSSLLYAHSDEIKIFKKKLEEVIEESISELNISTTIQEYVELKEYYGETVRYSNNIFTSITIFGIIGTYFAIINYGAGFNYIFMYIDLVGYLILQVVYVISINKIKNVVGDIKQLVESSKFISLILHRSDFADVHGDVYDNYKTQNVGKLGVSDNLNKNGLKTPIAQTKRNDRLGLGESSPRRQSFHKRIIIETREQVSNDQDFNKKIDLIKNITFRSMIISNESATSLDWTILNNKLSDPWEHFIVVGFEIDDSQMMQQLLSMGLGLLGIMQINSLLSTK